MPKDIERKKEYNLRQPIAGPSRLCKKKKQTTPNTFFFERNNESDTTHVSSQDEFQDNELKLTTQNNAAETQQPVLSFMSIKGKGKGKKSKLKSHNTNNIDNYDSETNKRLNATTTDAKFIRKKTIRKSSISSTSVSDIMSVHSDSDLLDVDFDKHSSDEYREMDTLPCMTEIKNNDDFGDKRRKKGEEDNNSTPLFFFDDKSGDEEVVIGEDNKSEDEEVVIGKDNNAVALIDKIVLSNKDFMNRDEKKI